MEEDTRVRLHASVQGQVQGVGFRMFVQRNAQHLGLTGWVRNRWNGTVEVTAEGSRENLEQLLQLLHQGPHSGLVTGVKPDWRTATDEFTGFHVRYSA